MRIISATIKSTSRYIHREEAIVKEYKKVHLNSRMEIENYINSRLDNSRLESGNPVRITISYITDIHTCNFI